MNSSYVLRHDILGLKHPTFTYCFLGALIPCLGGCCPVGTYLTSYCGDEAAAHEVRGQVAQELADEWVLLLDVLLGERHHGRRHPERRLLLVHHVDELDDAGHHALVLRLDQRPRAVDDRLHPGDCGHREARAKARG